MGFKDLVITPIFLTLIYFTAFIVRPYLTDRRTKSFFIPALTVKIIGAIAVGLIYQFYYDGGDTFTYFTHGSAHIYEAWLDDPLKAFQLITANGEYSPSIYLYASKIWLYRDQASYFVIRVAGILDIITFHTYSSTAVLFAVFAFSGSWAMYLTFYRIYPGLYRIMGWAIFFVPSVILWGSGLLKDTLTFGAVGWLTYAFYQFVILKRPGVVAITAGIASIFLLYQVKIYILLSILPSLLLWWSVMTSKNIRSPFIRASLTPVLVVLTVVGSYFALARIGESNRRYNLDQIAKTAEATARWLNYVSTVEEGSGYNLGDFDFTPMGMLRKSPQAVAVTLYRPFPWESNNILMLFSSIESFFTMILSLYILFKVGIMRTFRRIFTNPEVFFGLAFSIIFAFAIGISTYNFGSLVRYKIPLLPFYFIALAIIYYLPKRQRLKN
ncbi:hypothetical protein AB9P05_05780 [Roseivirga sp. BDSF3-8]|uniref:hypothetical protein n=1 Tax=Roseivirga sp. BDSF3-8 TaxID=3241598 RepID=UPI0035320016